MSNPNQSRKVLFFCAASKPTVAEQALIDRIVGDVKVRSVADSTLYGTRAESCDVVAKGSGVTIPAAYSAKTDVTPFGTGTDATVSNGQAVTGVTVTGLGTTATFTTVAGVITAIALS